MKNLFLRHVEEWLPVVLRAKVLGSASEDRLCFIGAGDFAAMLTGYVLTRVAHTPESCWSACDIEGVTDDVLGEVTNLSGEVLAAGFIGAAVELAEWHGETAVVFMLRHGVPEDAAWEVAHAIEVVTEKLGARGQALIGRLDVVELTRASREPLARVIA
jgi:hypothetical protein